MGQACTCPLTRITSVHMLCHMAKETGKCSLALLQEEEEWVW